LPCTSLLLQLKGDWLSEIENGKKKKKKRKKKERIWSPKFCDPNGL
jgi:hypothetical protein